jgi:hypothetical protein
MEPKVIADDFSGMKADRPTKVTITFEVGDGHNRDVIALIGRILSIPGSENEEKDISKYWTVENPDTKAKIQKPRKVREYTDADRAAFRDRMVAAREAKLAKQVEEQKAKEAESKKIASKASTKPESDVVTKLAKIMEKPTKPEVGSLKK